MTVFDVFIMSGDNGLDKVLKDNRREGGEEGLPKSSKYKQGRRGLV